VRKSVLVAKDQARLKAIEEAKKLKVPQATLPVANVGIAYDARIAASGGAGGYAFTIAGDTHLPKGLTLDPDGRLRGVPEAAGTSALTIQVKDTAGAEATGKIALTILPPPEIPTERLPEVIAGQPYRATVRVSGMANPRWEALGLPEGLAIAGTDGGAVISGTTDALGTHTLDLRAQEGPRRAHRALDLLVSDSFAPDVTELPPATAWAAYQHRLGVRGPAQEYHWKLDGEGGGLTVADDGTVSGAPDKAGELTIAVVLSAADGRARRAELVVPVNPPPVIEEGEAIKAVQGEPLDRRLSAAGGTRPFAWSLTDGQLPTGFRLDPDGALRGATAETGDFKATVGLSDRWKAATKQELTISVTPSEHPPEDKKQQQDKQQQADQGDAKDQKQDQKKDQQNQDQGGKGQEGKDGKEAKKDGEQQQPEQEPHAADGKDQKTGEQQTASSGKPGEDKRDEAARQAEALDHAAGDRWLEQLPKEDRDALRGQLLRGAGPPRQKGNPW
jgi:hypothetical protein